jgi:transposase
MATQIINTRKKRKSYSRDFKADAVKLIVHQGYSIAEASRRLGIDYSVLRRWKTKLEGMLKNDSEASNREKIISRELRELKVELEKVTEERNTLLKALSRFLSD